MEKKITHFHNSLGLDQDLVNAYSKKNQSQEDFIYTIFLKYNDLTKSELLVFLNTLGDKITEMGVSRSLTNLQTAEKIMKTEEKRIGIYGVPNSVYRLIKEGDVVPVREHRLKLTGQECKILGMMINDFIDNNDLEEMGNETFLAVKGITEKLNKINY